MTQGGDGSGVSNVRRRSGGEGVGLGSGEGEERGGWDWSVEVGSGDSGWGGGWGFGWLVGLAGRDAFFFFQAEDGIRYYDVTGIQTCALPIYYPA